MPLLNSRCSRINAAQTRAKKSIVAAASDRANTVMGESENIPTSLIVCAHRPPINKIIHFNNAINKFEALGKEVQCILLFANILVFMLNLYYRKSHVSLPLMPRN